MENKLKLFNCSNCNYPILYDDVYNNVRIKEQPSHYAIMYKCSNCGLTARTAVSVIEWKQMEDRALEGTLENLVLQRTFELDLEAVNDIADLELYWKAHKPHLEDNRCYCPQCERKYNES